MFRIRRNPLWLLVLLGLLGVGDQDHDHVRDACRIGYRGDDQTGGLSLRLRFAVRRQTNDDIDAAIFKIEGVGVALAPITDNGDRLAVKQREIGILVIIKLSHSNCSLAFL